MSESEPEKSTKIDVAAFYSAIAVIVSISVLSWLIEHALPLPEETKKIFYAIVLSASAPVYQQLCQYFRQEPTKVFETDGAYRYIFSSAFTIALAAFALLEVLSFLAGMASVEIAQTLNLIPESMNQNEAMQRMLPIVFIVMGYMGLPIIMLFCIVIGWLVYKTRTQKALSFTGYFFASILVLSVVDMYLNDISQMKSASAIIFKPVFMSVSVLIGFLLKYAWTKIRPSQSQHEIVR